ncbi:MAG: hypothetical protein JSR18_13530 [Proteobacteria bacterium]|nr:hypothetical protein [Pseudomonadota bacterium]
MLLELPDPRPPVAPTVAASPLVAAVASALGQASVEAAAAVDAGIDHAFAAALAAGDGAGLAAIFAGAPRGSTYRHLWRRLAAVIRHGVARPGDALAVRLFALPLVIVAARSDGAADALDLPATLADPAAVAALLREHRVLGAHAAFSLADALVPASALALAALPGLVAAADAAVAAPGTPFALPPRALRVDGQQAAHLRFLVGAALASPAAPPLVATEDVGFAMPLADLLSRALASPQASVLVLPRAARDVVDAVADGRRAQREIAAQLFVGSALRTLRSAWGEPVAMLSAHRAPDAEDGGELRLGLSSPFSPRDAEGYRCPLLPMERVDDAVAMLVDLLADCRVQDVRVVPGVQPDRDPATGLTLLFKPAAGDGADATRPALN